MNSALYSLILLANPTIIHENRIFWRVLTILLLLLSRKDWRWKCESTAEATPLLWCGLSCVGRHGNAGRRRQRAIHVRALYSTCVARALWALVLWGALLTLFWSLHNQTTALCSLPIQMSISTPAPATTSPTGPLVYSTRPSLNRGKSLIGH